jgi:hypothetical protein
VNRNAESDFAELQGYAGESLGLPPPLADTILLREVSLLRPDTTPARLIRVEAMDSLLIRLAFDDYLDAESPLGQPQLQIAPDEGPGPEIDRLIWPRQVDSLRAVADSVAAEERRIALVDSLGIVADSLDQILLGMEVAGDTLGADTVGTRLEGIRQRMAPPEPREEPAPRIAAEPPPVLPQQEFFVLLAEPLVPDQLFQLTITGVENINALGGGGGEASFAWEPPEPEPSEEPDTAAVVPDTAGVPPDTAGVPPDTGRVTPPDTGRATPAEARRSDPLWWIIRRLP